MKRSVAWTMWSIGSLFYAYQYILRVAPNIMLADIMRKYSIDAAIFGQYSGIYYFGYSLIHIPLGLLLDRFGPKRVMPLFMMLTVVGMLPLVVTDFWVYPVIGRLLVGMGSSAAILGLFKIIRMAFAESRFTWMLSLSVTIGLLGAIYGGAPLYRLHAMWGLENVVIFLMSVGTALSGIAYLVIPQQTKQNESRSVTAEVLAIFRNRYVMVVCFLAGLMVGPLEGFADVWGATFLSKVHGMNEADAAAAPSMIFLGMCFGGPLLSLWARRIGDIPAILVSGIVMMAAFAILLAGWAQSIAIPVVFFVVGVFCAYQIVAIAHAATHVEARYVGLTSAVANMIIMIFGYVFHAAIGKTVHYFSGGIDAVTVEGLYFGVLLIPVSLAISIVGYAILQWKTVANDS